MRDYFTKIGEGLGINPFISDFAIYGLHDLFSVGRRVIHKETHLNADAPYDSNFYATEGSPKLNDKIVYAIFYTLKNKGFIQEVERKSIIENLPNAQKAIEEKINRWDQEMVDIKRFKYVPQFNTLFHFPNSTNKMAYSLANLLNDVQLNGSTTPIITGCYYDNQNNDNLNPIVLPKGAEDVLFLDDVLVNGLSFALKYCQIVDKHNYGNVETAKPLSYKAFVSVIDYLKQSTFAAYKEAFMKNLSMVDNPQMDKHFESRFESVGKLISTDGYDQSTPLPVSYIAEKVLGIPFIRVVDILTLIEFYNRCATADLNEVKQFNAEYISKLKEKAAGSESILKNIFDNEWGTGSNEEASSLTVEKQVEKIENIINYRKEAIDRVRSDITQVYGDLRKELTSVEKFSNVFNQIKKKDDISVGNNENKIITTT